MTHSLQRRHGVVLLVCIAIVLTLSHRGWAQGDRQSTSDWVYIVKPGDNPWNLTQRILDGMKYWPEVQKYNRITDPLRIPPGTTLRIPIAWIRKQPATAVVTALRTGECFSLGDNDTTRPLNKGDQLPAGIVLRTGTRGFCTLQFPDKSRILLLGDSELRLERMIAFGTTGMYDIVLRLLRGRTESNVEPAAGPASRFEISSPQGVTSVRGTEYRVAIQNATGRVEVLSGVVGVSNSFGSVVLREGVGSLFRATAEPSPPVALLPAPDLVRAPKLIPALPRTIKFPPVPGATSYRTQIAREATFETLIAESQSSEPELVLPVIEDGEYALRARGIDANGFEGRNAVLGIKVERSIEPPASCSPAADTKITHNAATFDCAHVPEASKYRLQVARDSSFSSILEERVSTEPKFTLTLDEVGEYYWRVAATDQALKQGEYSAAYRLVREEIAPKVELKALGRSELTLAWSPYRTGHRYRFQMAENLQFERPLVDQVTIGDRLAVAIPIAGVYYFRVASISPNGKEQPFGPVHALNIPARPSLLWWPLGVLFLLAL